MKIEIYIYVIWTMNFFCHGQLPVADQKIKLCAKDTIIKIPLDPQDSEKLIQNCAPAKFGYGKKHVYDTTYRKAFALTSDDFCTNFNPYDYSDMIQEINRLFAKFNYIKFEKMNVYPEGGFFKSHKDTPQPNLLGTLVVCLPSEFEGGEFKIEDQIINFPSKTISYIAFFSERVHEVLPVKSGTRITLSYGIYNHEPFKEDNITEDVYRLIHSKLESKRLAYGCVNMSVKKMCLKGEDQLLYNWLENRGFQPKIKSILDLSINDMQLFSDETIEDKVRRDQVIVDDDAIEDAVQSLFDEDPQFMIFSDIYQYRNHVSYDGETADETPNIDDYEFDYECRIIKMSETQKLHLSTKCDCYGNNPYEDDAYYHSYYIVFNNPSYYSPEGKGAKDMQKHFAKLAVADDDDK